jgi:hypothetical protein
VSNVQQRDEMTKETPVFSSFVLSSVCHGALCTSTTGGLGEQEGTFNPACPVLRFRFSKNILVQTKMSRLP